MKPYVIGIDVGGTTVKMGFFTSDGQLLDKWSVVTDKSDNGKNILPDVAKSIREKLAEKNIPLSDIEGAGMGIPGAVTDQSLVHGCANIGWGLVDASAWMKEFLPEIDTKIVNDANAAALGELWKGSGAGCKSLVMVTLGTGVGGGIVIDGKVVEGAFGAAGEIGHIPVNPHENRACGCGKKGHLEQYASATGISRLAMEALEKSDEPSSLRSLDNVTAKDVFDAAKAGDAFAIGQAENLGRTLGRSLAMISCVVDPDMFLIGGGVSGAGEYLSDMISKYYREYAFHNSEATPIKIAGLGSDAGIYGAARVVL